MPDNNHSISEIRIRRRAAGLISESDRMDQQFFSGLAEVLYSASRGERLEDSTWDVIKCAVGRLSDDRSRPSGLLLRVAA